MESRTGPESPPWGFSEPGEGQRQGLDMKRVKQIREEAEAKGRDKISATTTQQNQNYPRGSLQQQWDHARTELLWSLAKESFASFHFILFYIVFLTKAIEQPGQRQL